MDFATIVALAEAVLLAAIAVLKIVAPKTKSTKDDAVLSKLESAEAAAEKYLGK